MKREYLFLSRSHSQQRTGSGSKKRKKEKANSWLRVGISSHYESCNATAASFFFFFPSSCISCYRQMRFCRRSRYLADIVCSSPVFTSVRGYHHHSSITFRSFILRLHGLCPCLMGSLAKFLLHGFT